MKGIYLFFRSLGYFYWVCIYYIVIDYWE